MSDGVRDYGVLTFAFFTRGASMKIGSDHKAYRVYTYLLAAPASSMTGVYQISVGTIADHCHMPKKDARAAMRKLVGLQLVRWDEEQGVVFVPALPLEQVGTTLAAGHRRRVGFVKKLEQMAWHPFASECWAMFRDAYSLGEASWESQKQGVSVDRVSVPNQYPPDTRDQRSANRDQGASHEHAGAPERATVAAIRHATGLSLDGELLGACQMAGAPRPSPQDLVDYEIHLAATHRIPANYGAGFVQWMRRKPQFERGRPQTADLDDEEIRARQRAKEAAEAMRRRQAGQAQ